MQNQPVGVLQLPAEIQAQVDALIKAAAARGRTEGRAEGRAEERAPIQGAEVEVSKDQRTLTITVDLLQEPVRMAPTKEGRNAGKSWLRSASIRGFKLTDGRSLSLSLGAYEKKARG